MADPSDDLDQLLDSMLFFLSLLLLHSLLFFPSSELKLLCSIVFRCFGWFPDPQPQFFPSKVSLSLSLTHTTLFFFVAIVLSSTWILNCFYYVLEAGNQLLRTKRSLLLRCRQGFRDWAWGYPIWERRRRGNRRFQKMHMSRRPSTSSGSRPERLLRASSSCPNPLWGMVIWVRMPWWRIGSNSLRTLLALR